ncbi:MAG TPA: hypothetical protein VK391_03340, partial [Allosphingosinicella sp.]|nr:hypothetical protein [Allosphingosinicella sp.]
DWLRRFVRPAGQANAWTKWRPPALVLLKSPPDPTSATASPAIGSTALAAMPPATTSPTLSTASIITTSPRQTAGIA